MQSHRVRAVDAARRTGDRDAGARVAYQGACHPLYVGYTSWSWAKLSLPAFGNSKTAMPETLRTGSHSIQRLRSASSWSKIQARARATPFEAPFV